MHTSNSWDFSKNYNMKIKVLENILLTEENETLLTLNGLCYLLPIQLHVYTQLKAALGTIHSNGSKPTMN